MKTLSIRQPWAWLILHAGKDYENRDWYTGVRGRIQVHAGKGMTRDEYEDAMDTYERAAECSIRIPSFEELERGGIVGEVEITDCIDTNNLDEKGEKYPSPWLSGRFGFKLANPKPLPFRPWRGQLGFFDAPADGEP